MDKIKCHLILHSKMGHLNQLYSGFIELSKKGLIDLTIENKVHTKEYILEAIINAEKLEADEETINSKLKEMAELYGKKEEELKLNENFMNYITDSIKNEKVIDFIVKNAKIK